MPSEAAIIPMCLIFISFVMNMDFFVIAEADNESHGTQSQYLKDSSWENVSRRWNERISDTPEFISRLWIVQNFVCTGRRTALVL